MDLFLLAPRTERFGLDDIRDHSSSRGNRQFPSLPLFRQGRFTGLATGKYSDFHITPARIRIHLSRINLDLWRPPANWQIAQLPEPLPIFDSDGNGVINSTDLSRFGANYGLFI